MLLFIKQKKIQGGLNLYPMLPPWLRHFRTHIRSYHAVFPNLFFIPSPHQFIKKTIDELLNYIVLNFIDCKHIDHRTAPYTAVGFLFLTMLVLINQYFNLI